MTRRRALVRGLGGRSVAFLVVFGVALVAAVVTGRWSWFLNLLLRVV